MAGFEKVVLATGEPRADYIRRRLAEGAPVKTVLAEINAAGFYSGLPGKTWPASVVYAEQKRATPKPAIKEPPAEDEITIDTTVPPQFEGILTEEDMAEVHAEAKAILRKSQREKAKKEALAEATRELERQAKLAVERGAPKGDMVDVQIDLAPYTADIKLDGKVFEHGTIRRVERKVAAVLMEQMQRSWQHEEGLRGKNDRPYRRNLAQRGITANNYQAAMVKA